MSTIEYMRSVFGMPVVTTVLEGGHNACIECGSGCNGVTGIGPATNYVDTWTIRKGTILFDSKFGPGGSNRHEVSYVKESCW